MGHRKVAIIGAGITKFVRRAQETGKELSWQAARMALDSCELTLDDVDCVTLGTAPDAFDGVHMKGEYLADGAGGFRNVGVELLEPDGGDHAADHVPEPQDLELRVDHGFPVARHEGLVRHVGPGHELAPQ